MSNPYDGSQLCAQTDPEIFFPKNNFIIKQEIRLARSICNKCPILNECREYAESQVGLHGVWAGKMYYGEGYLSPISVLTDDIVLERKIA
jgi:hypothetical protein